MIMELLAHKNYLRVLHAIERKPVRFCHLETELRLNPTQVVRALKFMTKNRLIEAGLADSATGIFLMVYRLTPRGVAFLKAYRAFALIIFRLRRVFRSGRQRAL